MAGVAGHSGYKGDPWGRLQRTSHYLAITTFGTVEHAEEVIAHVRSIHERGAWSDPQGRAYPPATRACCGGCTSPRSTRSCERTRPSARRR